MVGFKRLSLFSANRMTLTKTLYVGRESVATGHKENAQLSSIKKLLHNIYTKPATPIASNG